jgi:hypothetical protein
MKIPPQDPKILSPSLTGTLHLPTASAANMPAYKEGGPLKYTYASKPTTRKPAGHAFHSISPGQRYVSLPMPVKSNPR